MNQPQYSGKIRPEDGQKAMQEMIQQIQRTGLPPELLIEIGSWADRVLADSKLWPQMREWLISRGIPETKIANDYDPQFLARLSALAMAARQMMAGTAA